MNVIIKTVVIIGFMFNILDNLIAIERPQLPLITPHISPITSLQNDDTFSLFLIKLIAVFDPITFCAAMLWNDLSSLVDTATPIISNIIPKNINTSTKIILITNDGFITVNPCD